MKNLLLILSMMALPWLAYTQQDAMFTKYMFNTLIFNPAYAGSYDYLSINAIHRSQWLGIDGAPTTQSLTIHSPVSNRVGLGFSLVNDAIGPVGTTQANFVYAYRFKIGKGTLSTSLQAGVFNWRADWTKLTFKDGQAGDPAYQDPTPNRWMPNFGAGIYYQSERYFLGFSSPHIVNHDLRKKGPNDTDDMLGAQLYRHYYAFGGMVVPIRGEDIVCRPTFLVRRVGLFENNRASQTIAAPTGVDLDLGFFFFQKLWIGVSYRTAVEAVTNQSSSVDSGDIWAAVHFRNGLRIGAAYDYTLSSLQRVGGNSFEVMIGYELDYRVDRVITPRYF
jgi:type IX secretion system PorP/SprF family membrane protein